MENKDIFKKFTNVGAGPAGLFATCTGFFCDFVKPFMNLVPYFFGISIIASIIIWRFVLTKKLRNSSFDEIVESPQGKIFGMSLVSTLFWMIMIPIFTLTPPEGIAASVSPDLSNFQQQIFGKLDQIEQKIESGFEQVLVKIDQIDSNAGLISSPKNANDFYHNAKIHELNGNLVEAKKNYEEYFKANYFYLDPYLSYSLILKNLEGVSTSREILGKMRDTNFNNPAVQVAYILTKEVNEDKIQLLTDLAQKYPDFGPISYYLGELYSYKESGSYTNAKRTSEREAFQQLIKLEEDQKFSKYFIDKKLAEEKLNYAKQELKVLGGIAGNMIDNPVDFRIEYANNAASISFIPTELVKKIFYRIDEKGEFKDTGSMGITTPGLDTPLPNYQVMEALTLGPHIIEMKYLDAEGKESPVYRHEFTIEPLKLQSPPYKMIDPKTGKDQYMVFWSTFDSSKEYQYAYSLDNDQLNQKVENGTLNLTDLSKGKHTLYLQGTSGSEKTNVASMEFEVM